jgi:hypothetical protein
MLARSVLAALGSPRLPARATASSGVSRLPTVHTVTAGDADLYEEVLTSLGFV